MAVNTVIVDKIGTLCNIFHLEDGTLFEAADGTRGVKTFGGWITFSENCAPVAFVDSELDNYPIYKQVYVLKGTLDITLTVEGRK